MITTFQWVIRALNHLGMLIGFSLFINTIPLFSQISYEVQFVHDGKIVYGTFSAPSNDGKYPIVIIAPGSGPNDRNGTFTLSDSTSQCLYPEIANETVRPYKQLSEALVDSGFAVLRYDKLEFTYPPSLLGSITFHKLWLPVESAINYIKTRADVDTNCITLLGHSEGSLLIPYISLSRTDVKSLISLAGPRTPLDSLLAYQVINIAKTCNDDTLAAHELADQVLEYFHFVRVNHGIGLPPAFGVPAIVWYDYLVATEAVSENYNSVNLPTLFIGFGQDINVPPTELDRLQNEVIITNDFWSLPNLIHYMNPYNDSDISEELTDTIIFWLKQRCLSTSIENHGIPKSDFWVYPNPFQEEISVSMNNTPQNVLKVSIKDSFGRNISQLSWNPSYLPMKVKHLNNLPVGVYYLVIKSEERASILKIIKN